jgi:hypothetical protein
MVCYPEMMRRLLTIRSVLTGLALLGLVLSPLARPAAAMVSGTDSSTVAQGDMAAHAAMDMADMPCCPDQAPMPGCGKDCPFMAACTAQFLYMPHGAVLALPLALASIVVPGNDAGLTSLTQRPPPRPPKI